MTSGLSLVNQGWLIPFAGPKNYYPHLSYALPQYFLIEWNEPLIIQAYNILPSQWQQKKNKSGATTYGTTRPWGDV